MIPVLTNNDLMRGNLASILLLVVITLFVSACGDSASDEDKIKNQLQAGVIAIESRNSGDALDIVSETFTDQDNNTRKDLHRILMGYFLRYKDIGVFYTNTAIEIKSPGYAEATFNVVLTGGEHLIPDDARHYDVHSCWRNISGEWLLSCLRWE